MSDVETARVTVGDDGAVELPERIAEIVEANRETIELVAAGDDEPAEWAQAWLQEAEDDE